VLDALEGEVFRGHLQDELADIIGAGLATQPFGEDVDLGWRVRRLGARTAFAPDAIVHHEVLPPNLRVALHRAAVSAGFPLITREVPELRDEVLHRRWFLGPHRPAAWALTGGLAALAAHRRSGWLLVLAWVWWRLRPHQPDAVARLRAAPQWAAQDLVETAALSYSSARTGTLVL
jgi:hypothetical protein